MFFILSKVFGFFAAPSNLVISLGLLGLLLLPTRFARAGTNRRVKAGPTRRLPVGASGFGPFIQHRRMPFFSSMVVMVAVVISRSVS